MVDLGDHDDRMRYGKVQDDPELATSIEPNITTGHQDWNSMELRLVATSSTSWSTRDGDATTSLR